MPKSSRGRHGVRKTSVPSIIGQSYTTTQTYLTNLGFIYVHTTVDTDSESNNLVIYSQGLSSGSVVPFGTSIPFQYYVYVPPFFPPFFPYFAPPFFPFFPFFPPAFPYFDPTPPFFPYFPPAFPFFPYFPYFPYFPPPFFPYFPPYFPPFFPPAFGPYFTRCVDGETLILTSEGPKKAKDIKVKDTLLTVNLDSLTSESNAAPLQINVEDLKITNLVNTKVTNIIASNKVDRVYFNDNEKAQFTETHPIFVKRNNEYRVVEAGTIQEGDMLISIDPDALSENIDINKVISETLVIKVNKNTLSLLKDVYTFSCDPFNWYFAGNILTHNK